MVSDERNNLRVQVKKNNPEVLGLLVSKVIDFVQDHVRVQVVAPFAPEKLPFGQAANHTKSESGHHRQNGQCQNLLKNVGYQIMGQYRSRNLQVDNLHTSPQHHGTKTIVGEQVDPGAGSVPSTKKHVEDQGTFLAF